MGKPCKWAWGICKTHQPMCSSLCINPFYLLNIFAYQTTSKSPLIVDLSPSNIDFHNLTCISVKRRNRNKLGQPHCLKLLQTKTSNFVWNPIVQCPSLAKHPPNKVVFLLKKRILEAPLNCYKHQRYLTRIVHYLINKVNIILSLEFKLIGVVLKNCTFLTKM